MKHLDGIDYDGFAEDIFALKKDLESNLGEQDVRHLRNIVWINRLCTLIGYGTAWIFPNPISALLISQGIFGRWMIMHHVGHGGYDRVPGMPARYHSKRFAQGWRRYFDWFDWIYPPAWHHEHNVLHHLNVGEDIDPDLVEDHTQFLRHAKLPKPLKYVFVMLVGFTWKFLYYAPNTLRVLALKKIPNDRDKGLLEMIWEYSLDVRNVWVRQLWLLCFLPYVCMSFIIIPSLFLPLGIKAVLYVLINRILAEFITNFHSFMVIAPNHSGEDIYRFDYHFKGKGEFAVNQVISSCNYHCGTEFLDYTQNWLNYQIEHHLYPRMPMLKYRDAQPQVKAICEKYDIPYVQESVWRRFWKMIDICVGNGDMKWLNETDAAVAASAIDADASVAALVPSEAVEHAPLGEAREPLSKV